MVPNESRSTVPAAPPPFRYRIDWHRIDWRRAGAGGCLAVPFAALLAVPLYARDEPQLGGLPFFYWYQLAWVPLSALLLAIAYRLRSPNRTSPMNTPGGTR